LELQVLPMLRRIGFVALLMVVSLPVNAETDDIKEWHKQIHTQLKSNTRFPPAARGQTGTAKVGFVLDRQGKLVSHWLAESTGNRVLDEESLAILERTQSFPMPPPDLKEDHLTLAIPFDYRPRRGLSGQESGLWDQEQARLRAKVDSVCRGC
jgi:protein TonB